VIIVVAPSSRPSALFGQPAPLSMRGMGRWVPGEDQKFLCPGYMDEDKWDSMSKSGQVALIEGVLRLRRHASETRSLRRRGALQSARAPKTLRWTGGRTLVADGPFAETKEQLDGLLVLEARDMNRAVELMSKHPGVRLGGPFEIRGTEGIPHVHRRIGKA
jgi:hypothetical protein